MYWCSSNNVLIKSCIYQIRYWCSSNNVLKGTSKVQINLQTVDTFLFLNQKQLALLQRLFSTVVFKCNLLVIIVVQIPSYKEHAIFQAYMQSNWSTYKEHASAIEQAHPKSPYNFLGQLAIQLAYLQKTLNFLGLSTKSTQFCCNFLGLPTINAGNLSTKSTIFL